MPSVTSDPLPETQRTRWSARLFKVRTWAVDHAPLPLLTHAHEVALSGALVLVGLPFVLGELPGPESVHSQVPFILARIWAWDLMLSGLLTIVGLFWAKPRVEWAGQLFMGYGLTFYAAAILFSAPNWNGLLASAIFGVLGVIAWFTSWKITHAPLIQHRLVREARAAHEQVHVSRMKARRRKGVVS